MRETSQVRVCRATLAMLCIVVPVIVSGCKPPNDGTVSLDTILQSNLNAVRSDGRTGLVGSMNSVVSITENGSTVTGHYRATSSGAMRIDIFSSGERVYSEGTDVDGAWEWPGGQDKPKNVYHEGAAALNRGVEYNLFAMAAYSSRGHRIELAGEEIVDDQRYYVLKVTLSDGFEHYRYVNAESWQVELTREHRSLHPAVDPTQKDFETRFEHWQTVDGVTYAGRELTIDRSNDEVVQTMRVLEAAYNLPDSELNLARGYSPDGPP